MSDDLLERATAALRESTRTPPADGARQRARLLEQATKQARPAPYWQWAAVALTGVFVSSAMAHFSGYLPELLRALSRDDSPAQESRRGQAPRRPTVPAVRPVAPVMMAEPLQPTAADVAPAEVAEPLQPTAADVAPRSGVSTPGTTASSSGAASVSTPGTAASSSGAASADASTARHSIASNSSPRVAADLPASRRRGAARLPSTPRALENAIDVGAASEHEHNAAASSPPSAAAPAPASPTPSAAAPAPAAASPTPSATAPAPASPTPSAAPAAASPTPSAAPASPTPSAAPALAPEKPAEAAELALFRRAQTLHLSRDPKALAAWDAYLRLASHGALAPEARYNRALCLVRLGRYDEARAALEAFAHGTMHGYRQREAAALLARLPR